MVRVAEVAPVTFTPFTIFGVARADELGVARGEKRGALLLHRFAHAVDRGHQGGLDESANVLVFARDVRGDDAVGGFLKFADVEGGGIPVAGPRREADLVDPALLITHHLPKPEAERFRRFRRLKRSETGIEPRKFARGKEQSHHERENEGGEDGGENLHARLDAGGWGEVFPRRVCSPGV